VFYEASLPETEVEEDHGDVRLTTLHYGQDYPLLFGIYNV